MLELRDVGREGLRREPGIGVDEFSERDNASWALAASDVADAVASILATPPDGADPSSGDADADGAEEVTVDR